MTDHDLLVGMAHELAGLIGRRDGDGLRALFAPGFMARGLGADAMDAEEFVAGVEALPGEIVFVHISGVMVDLTPTGALVTGVQHARVELDGEVIDDRRSFADWFVKIDGGWRLQAALDIPAVIEDAPPRR